MEIKPSTCLRNEYNSISQLAHETGKPIFLTRNGEGDLVVMSIEAYEKREAFLALKEILLRVEAARLSGAPSYSLEEAKLKLKSRSAKNAKI